MSLHTDSVMLLLWYMYFMHITPVRGTFTNEHLIGMLPSVFSGRVAQ